MKVRLTGPANRDLERLFAYVAQDSPAAAAALLNRLLDRIMNLGDAPESGRLTDQEGVRVVTVPRLRYFVFYRIRRDEVQVLHIRHTSRRRIYAAPKKRGR